MISLTSQAPTSPPTRVKKLCGFLPVRGTLKAKPSSLREWLCAAVSHAPEVTVFHLVTPLEAPCSSSLVWLFPHCHIITSLLVYLPPNYE